MTGSKPRMLLLIGLALFPFRGGAAIASDTAGDPVDRFRIYADAGAVVRVEQAALAAQGLSGEIASQSLALWSSGQPVPIHVDDGGDGRFGPGDALSFVAQVRQDDRQDNRQDDRQDDDVHLRPGVADPVFVLSTDGSRPGARMRSMTPEAAPRLEPALPLRRRVRWEENLLRVPVAGSTGLYENQTLWFWQSMNHLASLPTRIPLDALDAAAGKAGTLDLTVRFGGGSDAASSAALAMPDHVVDVELNGQAIGAARFSGRGTFVFEANDLPVSMLLPSGNSLSLRVPQRRPEGADAPLIDVVQLDWIEVEFPVDVASSLDAGPVFTNDAGALAWPANDAPVTLYSESGDRAVLPSRDRPQTVPVAPGAFWLVSERGVRKPIAIEGDRSSNLRSRRDPVDYFVIAPSDLLPAVQPLVELHRRRGLRVESIDLQDVYDEFNHGRVHPGAVRDFLAHAHEQRAAPAPRFVLLVGDADWWATGERPSRRTDESAGNGVPTWQVRSRDGPVASDLPFVDFGRDPWVPAMAIGRFPAATPAQARAMATKTVAYLEDAPSGDWRKRVVLASERGRSMEQRNDRLAQRAEARGRTAVRTVAAAGDASEMRAALRRSFDDGALLMHFFGHGGRFMWQVGARNGGAGPDLFAMDDLDRLAPSDRLPVVLSLSCNTAPFDHPSADSLAEKMLRLPDRGAVAVVAASARNSPLVRFSEALVDELLSGHPVGEALLRAKAVGPHPDIAYFYNLLGDPALVLVGHATHGPFVDDRVDGKSTND